ncbi:protein MOR1 [Tanacetum coccineum]
MTSFGEPKQPALNFSYSLSIMDTGLQSSAAVATRNATIKLIGVLLKFVGPDIKAFLSDVMPALLSVVEAECEENPFKGAAAAPKKTVKASDSVSSLFCGGLDSLPREDNSGKITPELLKGLECSDWKMRSESIEAILMFSFPPEAEGFFGDIGPQMVLKNIRDIHGLALAIVLEPLNSHGAFPEVHDKTRATGTGPTVKTTSKILVYSQDTLITMICHVLTTRTTVDDEVAPRRNAIFTFKVPDQNLLTTRRTMDDEDAPRLKAVLTFQVLTNTIPFCRIDIPY